MIKKILDKFRQQKSKTDEVKTIEKKPERPKQYFSTEDNFNSEQKIEELWQKTFKDSVHASIAMDSAKGKATFATDNSLNVKNPQFGIIPNSQMLWYAGQSFIGYQLCAILAQQWLIGKSCLTPAKDATRNGYDITVNDGSNVTPEVLDDIRKQDIKYQINKNLIEFVNMGRVFGIRIAKFVVESNDPDYYKNPFNIDGVTEGSYKGISQIDPYWITPQLDAEASGNPGSINFYEPTWWVINGQPIHRTHLVIFRNQELPDVLKPSYIFGGISIPQLIAERVYAAEKVANEAPMLAMTKRTDVINADVAMATVQYSAFEERIKQWVYNRDNYGIKVLGLDEKMAQFDTSLADLDAVIMTQFQLVAATVNIPAVKLVGTILKGFNSTGTYEEASYHEELESIQKHDLSALLDRHHELLIKSEIAPKYNIAPFNVVVSFSPVNALTAQDQAIINKAKADAGQVLIMSGAIDSAEERQRVINDPTSGYNGLQEDMESDPESELIDLTEE